VLVLAQLLLPPRQVPRLPFCVGYSVLLHPPVPFRLHLLVQRAHLRCMLLLLLRKLRLVLELADLPMVLHLMLPLCQLLLLPQHFLFLRVGLLLLLLHVLLHHCYLPPVLLRVLFLPSLHLPLVLLDLVQLLLLSLHGQCHLGALFLDFELQPLDHTFEVRFSIRRLFNLVLGAPNNCTSLLSCACLFAELFLSMIKRRL
jgi:hypothetical protein